jgi:hypothetical protein
MAGRIAILAGEQQTGSEEPLRGFDASGFGIERAVHFQVGADGPEDDPALRVLGHHGQLLERVLTPLRGQVDLSPDRLGLYVALGSVDTPPEEFAPAVLASRDVHGRFDLAAFYAGAYRHVHPLWPLTTLNNVSMGQLAIDLDVRGDSLVLTSDADAGIRALLEAQGALLEGVVDRALVGAVSERVSPASLARARLRGRDEVVRERAVALLLAREEDAPEATALLRGGATAFGVGARSRALLEACRRADLDPAAVREVECDEARGCGAAMAGWWIVSRAREASVNGAPQAFLATTAAGAVGCVIVEVVS